MRSKLLGPLALALLACTSGGSSGDDAKCTAPCGSQKTNGSGCEGAACDARGVDGGTAGAVCSTKTLPLGQWVDLSLENAPRGFPSTTGGWNPRGLSVYDGGEALFLDDQSSQLLGPSAVRLELYAFDPCSNSWKTRIPSQAAPDFFTSGASTASYVWTGTNFVTFGTHYGPNNQNSIKGFFADRMAQSWREPSAAELSSPLVVVSSGNVGQAYLLDPSRDYASVVVQRFASTAGESTAGTGAKREGMVALVGHERFVVWGGTDGTTVFGDGQVLDVATRTWKPMTQEGAPSPRYRASMIEADGKVIVWGGYTDPKRTDQGVLANGAVYDPAGDSWTAISGDGGPTGDVYSSGMSVIWAQGRLIVANTRDCGPIDGHVYDVQAKTWTKAATNPISTLLASTCVKPFRSFVSSGGDIVWTTLSLKPMWIFKPKENAWEERVLPERATPLDLEAAMALWTGDSFVIWGPYRDTTKPNQCPPPPPGGPVNGCDPVSSGEFLKSGAMVRVTE